MSSLGYRTVDADNHYYETRDAFSRYIDPAYASRTLLVHTGPDGRDAMTIDGQPYVFSPAKFDTTNPPGSLLANLRDPERAEYARTFTAEAMLPGYQDRDARLQLMDDQGIEAAILLPSLAVCVEHPIRHDPGLTNAVLHAFNRWLEDDWGYGYRDRIYGVPLLSLVDIDLAVAELDRVLGNGARLVHLLAGPVNGRSPADPHFDPFWARLNEAHIPVVLHIGDSGYAEMFGAQWGEEPRPQVRSMSAFSWAFLHGDMPVMHTLGAMTYHNLFGRFPNVTVLSIENGSDWVSYLMTHLDKKKGMGRQGPWPGGYFHGRPSDVLKDRLYLTPYPEDDVLELVGLMGDEHVLFGSDHPHPEGLAEPDQFVELLNGLDATSKYRILRGNILGLLGRAV